MLSRPAGLSDDALRAALAEHWGVHAASLAYRAVGFGSHHWQAVETTGRLWFVTVDDVGADDGGLRAALTTALALRAAGHQFVISPVLSVSGEPFARLGQFAVACYPEIAGEHYSWGEFASDEHRLAVLGLLVELHAVPRETAASARVDDFAIPWRDDLEAGVRGDVPAAVGPFGEPARDHLEQHRDRIVGALAMYDRLVEMVSVDAPERGVITHGEPHAGNTIRTESGWVLIDWDTALVAPPERDLWSFAGTDGAVLRAYTDATGREIVAAAVDLYRIGWELKDLAVYTARFRRPHTGNADDDKSWEGLRASVHRLPG